MITIKTLLDTGSRFRVITTYKNGIIQSSKVVLQDEQDAVYSLDGDGENTTYIGIMELEAGKAWRDEDGNIWCTILEKTEE